ncbi:endo-1,4-beta-xylanase [Thermoclostridium stercorarium subsp. stercorarium DSM 8532]|uniref:Beta-xylanase n=1 Tax=Thermoclostridium stercorarium (strain ATCC 35414 / DSM 8532 / NCIMB 11754) TaxID=1121335 RepID=L7VLT8_THES1|nr:endo-1,4-beta-xylanase [Thermoclostridium stercorarium]AGC67677.1 endo-1,4-beta-xylanase [Thermoclostridium stercorarium subsp. stercorarium DSM 8532]AGI38724.1 XynC [Thermoclostridium stercorarium subsp. stercorarium DSM 8532]
MNGRNGGKRPIASLLVLTLAFLFIPVTKAETTVYHETFAEGKGAAVQSGGATITHVTGKFFDGNGDGAALYISNRVNNWDAADFRFSDIGLQDGRIYKITVKGYVDPDVHVPEGSQIWLQTVNSYGWWGSTDIKAGEAFTLTGVYKVDTTNDYALRIQSNDTGAFVPFYIGEILITEETVPQDDSRNGNKTHAEKFTPITFEDQTTGGFTGRAGTEILTVTDEANHTDGGRYSLKVGGRNDTWHGPALGVEKYVDQGYEYKVAVYVRLISPESAQLQLSTQIGEGTSASYVNLAKKNVAISDGWVLLEGTYRYDNLGGGYLTIYVESPDSPEASFYIDDINFEPTGMKSEEIEKGLKSLKDVYKDNFLTGTAISLRDLEGVRFELLKKHFNAVTAENAMKPSELQREKGNFTFDGADRLVNAAISAGMKVHGHTLVWHQQTPAWMNIKLDSGGNIVYLSREEALENMRNHIRTVIEHFGDKVISWDVVNEAMSDNPSNPSDWRGSLRKSPWYYAIGEDYVEQAFLAAREVLDEHPEWDIKLYYNDYNLDNQNKALAVYNMVRELNEKYQKTHPGKLLIDGIGMQGHYSVNTNPKNVELSLKRFTELGVEVSISELDIRAGSNYQLTEKEANAQAYLYAQLFKIFREYSDSIARVTFWGMDDGTSWRAEESPLLFDRTLKAKPAYYAVADPDEFIEKYKPETIEANRAYAVYGTPEIDGKTDEVWNKAPELKINRYQTAWHGADGTARVLYDENNLYVLIKVNDTQLDKGSPNPWEQDSVEIFIDENNAKTSFYEEDDGQYRVNFENETSFNPESIAGGFESAAEVSGTNYTLEVKIPFRTVKPVSNMQIGFDVQINDGKNGVRQSIATWNDPTGNAWQDTSVFGILTLKSKNPVTRGEAIVKIMKAYDMEPLENWNDNFSDASGSYAGYYARAKETGFVSGIGDNKIGAEIPLTREMFFTMIYNIERITGKMQGIDISDAELTLFSDYNDLSEWAEEAVKALVKSGRIKINGDLLPKALMDAEEVEAFLRLR